MDDRRELTVAVEDYAKTIYALQQQGKDQAVSNSAVAERLNVSAGSASAMIKKMDGLGLVERVPYRGVKLTEAGEKVALEVLRHHRLLELYLAEHLDVPWDKVHQEAEVLEHAISEELEELIAKKLGDPTVDPHGSPIPTRELKVTEQESQPLGSFSVGDSGVFVRVSDADPEMLRYLSERGIAPGDSFEVVSRQPFNGPLSVKFGDQVHVIGGDLTQAMQARVK